MPGGKVAHVDRVEWLNIAKPQTAVLALIQAEPLSGALKAVRLAPRGGIVYPAP